MVGTPPRVILLWLAATVALIGLATACSGSFGEPQLADSGVTPPPPDAGDSCGDGICEAGLGEVCGGCVADCGECASCGDSECNGTESTTTCPEDCGTACGDSVCNGAESSANCVADCGTTCGDSVCNGAESSASCPADCGTDCGDSICSAPAETSTNCPADCGSVCGDGACNGIESSANCPTDCGSVCGDGTCNGGEDNTSCPGDCPPVCGNDVCELGETSCSCTDDCGTCAANHLDKGEALHMGDYLQSTDGRFRLNLQTDCNLVLRYWGDANQPLWASDTGGADDNCILHMQAGDGNLVLYTGEGIAIWSPHTEPDGFRAVMQDDGNFVVYTDEPVALWWTDTCCY